MILRQVVVYCSPCLRKKQLFTFLLSHMMLSVLDGYRIKQRLVSLLSDVATKRNKSLVNSQYSW